MKFDKNSIRLRLKLIAGYLAEMNILREIDGEDIFNDMFKYRATERLQYLVIQSAVDINHHLLAELHGKTYTSKANVFVEAAEGGILPIELSEKLANTGMLSDLLAYQYERIDPFVVIENIESICIDFQRYLDCLENYVSSLQDDDTEI